MIPFIACSVNFSNNAVTNKPPCARALGVDRQTKAVTSRVNAVTWVDPNLVCPSGAPWHHLLFRFTLIPPQTGCLRAHERAVLVQLLSIRRDDLVESSIRPMARRDWLPCTTAARMFNKVLCQDQPPWRSGLHSTKHLASATCLALQVQRQLVVNKEINLNYLRGGGN